MLQPARTKYRKQQKGRNTGIATRGAKVSFGEFGLKATTRGRLTARQLEAARRAMSRHIKRGGRIWIRVFPDKPVSSKPAEVRGARQGGLRARLGQAAVSHHRRPAHAGLIGNDAMKPSELRGKNGDELQKELEGLMRAQFGLRMQLATQQLGNTSQLKKVKRDIARVRTIMKEKTAK
jgi:ribosomal protein L16/ribosomal protein L29